MKRLFGISLVAFLCVIVLTLFARPPGGGAHPGPYTAHELRDDLDQLRREMESCHPKLYAYASKADFESAFDDAINKLGRPSEIEEFYRIAAMRAAIRSAQCICCPTSRTAPFGISREDTPST